MKKTELILTIACGVFLMQAANVHAGTDDTSKKTASPALSVNFSQPTVQPRASTPAQGVIVLGGTAPTPKGAAEMQDFHMEGGQVQMQDFHHKNEVADIFHKHSEAGIVGPLDMPAMDGASKEGYMKMEGGEAATGGSLSHKGETAGFDVFHKGELPAVIKGESTGIIGPSNDDSRTGYAKVELGEEVKGEAASGLPTGKRMHKPMEAVREAAIKGESAGILIGLNKGEETIKGEGESLEAKFHGEEAIKGEGVDQ